MYDRWWFSNCLLSTRRRCFCSIINVPLTLPPLFAWLYSWCSGMRFSHATLDEEKMWLKIVPFRLSANMSYGKTVVATDWRFVEVLCVMGMMVSGVIVLSNIVSNYDCYIHHNNAYLLTVCNSYVQYVRRPMCRYPIKYYLIRKKKKTECFGFVRPCQTLNYSIEWFPNNLWTRLSLSRVTPDFNSNHDSIYLQNVFIRFTRTMFHLYSHKILRTSHHNIWSLVKFNQGCFDFSWIWGMFSVASHKQMYDFVDTNHHPTLRDQAVGIVPLHTRLYTPLCCVCTQILKARSLTSWILTSRFLILSQSSTISLLSFCLRTTYVVPL